MFTSLFILLAALSTAHGTVDLLSGITPDPIRLPSVVPGEPAAVAPVESAPKAESFLDKLTAPLSFLQGGFPCLGQTSLKSGKCMSFEACSVDGGFGDGKGLCLSGDAVCCVKPVRCGEFSILNNTVMANPGFPASTNQAGTCVVKLVKPFGISHIKLLIVDLELAQPDAQSGKCDVDSLSVSGGILPGFGLGKICGINSKTHIYIPTVLDLADIFIKIDLADDGSLKRRWLLRAEMIEAKSPERPPKGCVQYFREPSGLLTSLNFDLENKTGLGNIDGLKYAICIDANDACSIQFDSIFFDLGNLHSHSASLLTSNGKLNNLVTRGANPKAQYRPLPVRPSYYPRPLYRLPYGRLHRPTSNYYAKPKYPLAKVKPVYHRPTFMEAQRYPYSPFLYNLPAQAVAPYMGGIRPWAVVPASEVYSGLYKPPMKKPEVDADKLTDKLENIASGVLGDNLDNGIGSLPKVCPDQDLLIFPIPDDGTSPIHCGNDLHFGQSLVSSSPPFVIKVANKGSSHGKGFAVTYKVTC